MAQNLTAEVSVTGALARSTVMMAMGANVLVKAAVDLAADDPDVQVYAERRTIPFATSEVLNLTALANTFGNPLNLGTVTLFLLIAAQGNADLLQVGANVTAPFTGPFGNPAVPFPVQPGGSIFSATPHGYDVGGGLLKITNLSPFASASYDIVIVGRDGDAAPAGFQFITSPVDGRILQSPIDGQNLIKAA